MSALQEIAFQRLLPKYERVFGEPPPFTAATVDEAVAFMRDRLRGHLADARLACMPWIGTPVRPGGDPSHPASAH
jgi:hypothetical protein